MQSLKTRALLKVTKDMRNLFEVMEFCQTSRDGSACYENEDFWKETLTRLFGKDLVLQRGDFKGTDWYAFSKVLLTGRGYKYVMHYSHNGDGTGDFKGPFPYYAVVEIPPPDDIYFYKFKIPGVLPLPKTVGYFFRISYSLKNRLKETSSFVVAEKMEVALKNTFRCIAYIYRRDHITKFYTRSIDFFDEDNYHLDNGERPFTEFPSEEAIYQKLSSYNNITAEDGQLIIPRWFVHFDRNSRENISIETVFDISPIMF